MKELKHFDKKLNHASNYLEKGGKGAILLGSVTGQPEIALLGADALAVGKVGSQISKLLKKKKNKKH